VFNRLQHRRRMSASSPPRIVLIEDHTLVRQLLALLVRDHLHTEPVGEATTVAEGLAVAARTVPDLIVADWSLPDGDASVLVRTLAPRFPSVRWLIISSRADESVLRTALSLGVHGIVLKQSPLETFRDAIQQILAGGTYYCPLSSRALVDSVRSDSPVLGSPLTLRERDVLRGLAKGLNPKEIADSLGASAKTVQNQISQLKDKLGIREPAGLIRYAQQNGLLP